MLALTAHASPDDVRARAAALLHDVGHPPLSHTLEGVAGLEHHALGAARVAELEPVLRRHGLDAALLGGADARLPGVLGLDHLDSFLRSGQAHGRTRELASATLQRLDLTGGAVSTDEGTARYLVDLIAAEARSQCSALNITGTAVMRDVAARLAADPGSPALADHEFLALALGHPATRGDVELLHDDPTAWQVQLDEAAQGLVVEVRRLYLDLPLVDGEPVAPAPGWLTGPPDLPAHYVVARRPGARRAVRPSGPAGGPRV